jgi:hypothetical protein
MRALKEPKRSYVAGTLCVGPEYRPKGRSKSPKAAATGLCIEGAWAVEVWRTGRTFPDSWAMFGAVNTRLPCAIHVTAWHPTQSAQSHLSEEAARRDDS